MSTPTLRWPAFQRVLWLFVALLVACGDRPAENLTSSKPPTATAQTPSATAPLSAALPSPFASVFPQAASAPTVPASAIVLPSGPVVQAPAPKITRPFLYEVKGKKGSGFLFGTMHMAVDADRELPPEVFEKLDAAKVVLFEADVFSLGPADVAKIGFLKPGDPTVKSQLTPEHWTLLVDKIGGILMPESALEKMKASMLAGMLEQSMIAASTPIDKVLFDRAESKKKEVGFLESVDTQVIVMDKVITPAALDEALSDLPKAERQVQELVRAYREGDEVAVAAVVFDPEEMKKHPAATEDMLWKRNRSWIPELEKRIDAGNVFVAVGAAHLIGKDSVVELLTKKGYTIKRVELAPSSPN
ncbi:MAG: TraB/GumN family protein [Polyangiaceae bacterium]